MKYRIFEILFDFVYYLFGALIGTVIVSLFRPIQFYELSYAIVIAGFLTWRWRTEHEVQINSHLGGKDD